MPSLLCTRRAWDRRRRSHLPPSVAHPSAAAAGARAGRVRAGSPGRLTAEQTLTTHSPRKGVARPCAHQRHARRHPRHRSRGRTRRALDRVREHQVEVAVVELQQPFEAAETAPPPNSRTRWRCRSRRSGAARIYTARSTAARGRRARRQASPGRAAACRGPVGGAELAAQISGISWRAADSCRAAAPRSRSEASLGGPLVRRMHRNPEREPTDSSVTPSGRMPRGCSVRSVRTRSLCGHQARGCGLCSVEVDLTANSPTSTPRERHCCTH